MVSNSVHDIGKFDSLYFVNEHECK